MVDNQAEYRSAVLHRGPMRQARVRCFAIGMLIVGALQAAEEASWQAARAVDPYAGSEACVLRSRPLTMSDGYHGARVQLVLGEKALSVVTDSNLDPSYPRQGIVVDGGKRVAPDAPFPFHGQSAVFILDRDELVQQFRRGSTAELALGFWPTWPVTETQRLEISLSGFSAAHVAFLACVEDAAPGD
jgi:hypothetical protein